MITFNYFRPFSPPPTIRFTLHFTQSLRLISSPSVDKFYTSLTRQRASFLLRKLSRFNLGARHFKNKTFPSGSAIRNSSDFRSHSVKTLMGHKTSDSKHFTEIYHVGVRSRESPPLRLYQPSPTDYTSLPDDGDDFCSVSEFLLSHIDCTERLDKMKVFTREMFERDWALTTASRCASDGQQT